MNGRKVVDTENSKVTITRTMTSTDSYKIKWYITGSMLNAPTVKEDIKLTYNGTKQSVVKILNGYSSSIMKIVDGEFGTNADTYKAKIMITDDNYSWREGIGVEEDGIVYVYVEWKIHKADINLTNVSWRFTDGTTDYKNGTGMVYTRKGGKAVVYWAELTNLPEAIKSSIKYTTNRVGGANAGTDAGMYTTSFEIVDADKNFNTITLPENLPNTVTWSIQRRALEIPTLVGDQLLIFDDEAHDLLPMINLQEDWAEYFTITVMYAKNFIAFTSYAGYDGKDYWAHGAGAYRFVFNIIKDINTNPNNPNVVWFKGWKAEPSEDEVKEIRENEVLQSVEPVKEVALWSDETVAATAVAEVEVETVAETVEVEEAISLAETVSENSNITVSVAQQVCDRIKELTYGAQIRLNQYRRYLK